MGESNCPHCGEHLNLLVVVGATPVRVVEAMSQEIEAAQPPPPVHFGPPRKLRIEEAASIAGCSVRTFYDHSKAGKKPKIENGRVWSNELYDYLHR